MFLYSDGEGKWAFNALPPLRPSHRHASAINSVSALVTRVYSDESVTRGRPQLESILNAFRSSSTETHRRAMVGWVAIVSASFSLGNVGIDAFMAAHLHQGGRCSISVPAAGRRLLAAHHHQVVEHPPGRGNAEALLQSGGPLPPLSPLSHRC